MSFWPRPGSSFNRAFVSQVPICFLSWIIGFVLIAPTSLQAQQRVSGEWLIIPGQISSDVCNDIKSTLDRAMNRGVRKIVLEFQFRELSDFGPCYELANYLLENVKGRTQLIGFTSSSIDGFALLPLFACKTVYVTPEVTLGFDKNAAEKAQPDDSKISSFLKVASMRGRPPALLLKMLKPEFKVLEFQDSGRKFRIPRDQLSGFALSKDNLSLVALQESDQRFQPKVFRDAGTLGRFSALDSEHYGLVSKVYANRQTVSEVTGVSVGSTPLSSQPRAARIIIEGQLSNGILDMIQEKVRRAAGSGDKVDCIIFELNGVTGDSSTIAKASELAERIHAKTRDEYHIKTVAFVNDSCVGTGNFIALACDEIILGPDAKLGDMSPLVYKEGNLLLPEKEVAITKNNLTSIVEKSNHSPIFVRGFFENDLELIRVMEKADADKETDPAIYIIDARDLKNNVQVLGEPIKKKGKLLTLDAKPAVETGLARSTILSKDAQGVYSIYGISPNDVTTMQANWLDNLVFFLQLPAVSVLLFIIGIMGVILEMKAPGTTIPIIIAAVCFLLLFWSHSSGEVNVLAILLLLLGFVFIGVEVFLLPGFGVTGIFGILMMILSVSLLLLKHWPTNQDEYKELGKNFAMFTGALIFAGIAAFYLFKNIGRLPMFDRLLLSPPDETDPENEGSLPPAVSPSLLGAIGTSVTALRPAGKACFGEQYLDVSSESGYVDAGKRVQIVEIHGMNITVKAV